jgi:hypothetical protein
MKITAFMIVFLLLVSTVSAQTQIGPPDGFILPNPVGEYVAHDLPPTESDAPDAFFPEGQPIVATTYFYWYDATTNEHILNGDGSDALTDHPPTIDGMSYRNPDWHERELRDMIDAGIDVALPVYWGTPLLREFSFSNVGLPPLVEARERLLEEGERPPAIGMFYDTSSLRHNGGRYQVDLTTDAGKLFFYGTIRNFFSLIPPRHRAYRDGRPIVMLYSPTFAADIDETLFPAVREMFERDFGTDLFLIKQPNWPGDADSECPWGGALAPRIFDTAAIGPGYDHSAVPGRAPLIKPRDDGRFYTFSWERLLAMRPETRPTLVHLETWNEFHEGTEICATQEYGRKYIEMTAEFSCMFHAGEWIDLSERQPARESMFCTPDASEGLAVMDKQDGDGPIKSIEIEGRTAWTTAPNDFSPHNRYMYFDVEDYTLYDVDRTIAVTVEYIDAGPDSFVIGYDSADPKLAGVHQQFRSGQRVSLTQSGEWRHATFTLPHARFANRSNGADFRLLAVGEDLIVSRVLVVATIE